MVRFDVSLPRDDRQLIDRLFRGPFARDFRDRAADAIDKLEVWARYAIEDALQAEPTYLSLLSGRLQRQLGIGPRQRQLVYECVRYVAQSASAEYLPPDRDSLGGVQVFLLSGGVPALLARSFADYMSAGSGGVTTVPWLEWLLTGGSRVLLTGYAVRPVDPTPSSRSLVALTLPLDGYAWSLPDAGVEDDNWVTRGLEAVVPHLRGRIDETIRAGVGGNYARGGPPPL